MVLGFEELGGELSEGVGAVVSFGLGVYVNPVFGKDGGGAAAADHDSGDGSVVDALGLDDLEIGAGGGGGGDDDPVGGSGVQLAVSAGG